jgi:hypothetical protein
MSKKYYRISDEAIENYNEALDLLQKLEEHIPGISDDIERNGTTEHFHLMNDIYNSVIMVKRAPHTKGKRALKAEQQHLILQRTLDDILKPNQIQYLLDAGSIEELQLNPLQILQLGIFESEGDILSYMFRETGSLNVLKAGSLNVLKDAEEFLDNDETEDIDIIKIISWATDNSDRLLELKDFADKCSHLKNILKD